MGAVAQVEESEAMAGCRRVCHQCTRPGTMPRDAQCAQACGCHHRRSRRRSPPTRRSYVCRNKWSRRHSRSAAPVGATVVGMVAVAMVVAVAAMAEGRAEGQAVARVVTMVVATAGVKAEAAMEVGVSEMVVVPRVAALGEATAKLRRGHESRRGTVCTGCPASC